MIFDSSRGWLAPHLPALASIPDRNQPMSSFSTYLLGYFILVIGLAIGAKLLGAPSMWIGVGAIIAIGLGILMATSRTKPRDPQVPPPR